MRVYYARPISLYKTLQEQRDIETLKGLGFDVINPDKDVLLEKYKTHGMDAYLQIVSDCDALAFRSFPDLKISAGVKKEIDRAIELGKVVIELPTITEARVLSVESTREYLKYLGQR